MTTILSLPNEVMAVIVSNLDLRDLIRSGRVCRKWKELCGETNTVEGVATKDLYVLSFLRAFHASPFEEMGRLVEI